jgi:hypothetical protein
MTTPNSRFIDTYVNHRKNPFTGADLAVDKTEDHVPIPASSPFFIQLVELPRKDTPSSVSVYCYTSSSYFTEVTSAPAQGEFRVDYPDPDGEGTGLIEFNSNDAGKDLRIEYKATGSPIVAEILDGKLSWPSPTPGENQTVIMKTSVPTWAFMPCRYFHERDVVHNAGGESESCLLFRFKKGGNNTKVFLELKGAKTWQGHYTEFGQHNHAPGTLIGYQFNHRHEYAADLGGILYTEYAGDEDVTIVGSTATAGATAKTYPNAFKVYIDGVDKTSDILALSGLAALGDGTSGHAFVTTGTGEMEITSLLGGGSMHEIKVTEPVSAAGGRCLLHLEVY